LSDYLSTDELVELINKVSVHDHNYKNEVQSKRKTKTPLTIEELTKRIKRNTKIFIGLIILFIIHIGYLTLPLILPNQGLELFGMANVVAVPYNQDVVIDETGYEVYAAVVVIEKFNVEKLNIDDLVVIYGKFGSNVYWVERVIDFDLELKTITTSSDGFFESTDVTSFEDVEGYFVRLAGRSGALAYVSANLNGYLLIIIAYIVASYTIYTLFLERYKKKLKHLLKELRDEQIDHDINEPLI
jgi:uncharacterized membrane protein YobD (UPF0266 family)